ncbi:translation factor [Melanomma pulvis-pyrius CBS 109.77]|uniref:Threonylcarbamoyl-AMP synthase n=1 Tax=Melanomma pulvis-pyrius CBS 109.77 TaxID=1314802 RepID=A0A6A6XS92_9PLEO|nr:translation factor [Melanomma pulvis-pyrius CBS 109.77]
MPRRQLLFPNVKFIRFLSSYPRALQALAQTFAASPPIPCPPLSLPSSHYRSHFLLPTAMETDILPVEANRLGNISVQQSSDGLVDEWSLEYAEGKDLDSMRRAAEELATTDVPVAFPTETVYGLGADATRSSAVRAIFAVKGRPADNPLIVHVHSLSQLRSLLLAGKPSAEGGVDPIPEIYKPLIRKFWPGPLTIILPNPSDSVLAPEVTAGLSTFGARMPRSILALTLIRLSGVPLAGPSANASTRPSPTAAEHVKDDLNGRIRTIIDGGPCSVGVESTVVDGLSFPPTILRPGGVTVGQLRQTPGWENVVIGYKDEHEKGIRPRAPGMKYRHYSPKAKVILYEVGASIPDPKRLLEQAANKLAKGKKVGIIRTKRWKRALGLPVGLEKTREVQQQDANGASGSEPTIPETCSIPNSVDPGSRLSNLLRSVIQHQVPQAEHIVLREGLSTPMDLWDVNLGAETEDVARGLFSALRELDRKGVDVIFVEGIDDKVGGDIAAAVMNRLRKAAEIRV